MQTLQIIKLILSMLPAILEAILVIEKAIPQSDQGAAKLQIIKASIQAAYTLATDAVVTFERVWPLIEKVVETTVAAFNVAGVFTKK